MEWGENIKLRIPDGKWEGIFGVDLNTWISSFCVVILRRFPRYRYAIQPPSSTSLRPLLPYPQYGVRRPTKVEPTPSPESSFLRCPASYSKSAIAFAQTPSEAKYL